MPLGTARGHGSSGDFISHFAAVRIRVQGSGTLRTTLLGQDSVTSYALSPITMASASRFSPRLLANATEQRALVQVQTTDLDDDFTVHRIVVFAKPIWTEIPG